MSAHPKGMRIAELSRRSGTTKETIHFYLREGLLRKPKKTSRNMAYYDETHLEQLKLIKRLRTESYLPLQVIKKVLKEGKLAHSARQLDLSGELFGQGARAQFEPITKKELAKRTGVSEARINTFEEAGLIKPTREGRTKRYGYEDLRITETVRDAQKEAGEGAEELVVERFQILEKHMRAVVRDEVSHFFARVLPEGDPKRALEILRSGRETVGRFLAVARARRLRQEVNAILPGLEADHKRQAQLPFYYPLPETVADDLGEDTQRNALLDRHHDKPTKLEQTLALMRHLVLVGVGDTAVDIYTALSAKAQKDPELERLYAEALMIEERFADLYTWADKIHETQEASPHLEAIWGTTQLIRIRENFAKLEPSTELIGYLSTAFGAYDRARHAGADDLLTRARIRLMLGRVCLATPEFLSVHEQGREDLRGCIEDLRALANRAEKEKSLGWLRHGPLARLELNAVHFLYLGSDDPEERRELEKRETELRS